MRVKPGWRWRVVACLAALAPASLGATTLQIDRVAATSQGYLFVDYSLLEPFTGAALEAIRSGLPSTLTFTLEVWRQRAGWWDRLEGTREASFRVFRDLLNDRYVAVSREEVRRFADLDSLTAALCAGRREFLPPLAPSQPYYVVVSANLAPLSVEDLRELETWLQGTLRGGDEPGRVAGISGTMVGLLLNVTGFGDETVRVRSQGFVPAALPRAAPASRVPGADAPGVPPARADSSGTPPR